MRPAPKRRMRKARKAKVASKRPRTYRKTARTIRPKGRSLLASRRVRNVAGQLSFSSAGHYHRAVKLISSMKQLGTMNNIVNQSSIILTSASGLQNQYSYAMFDTTQLRQLLSNLTTLVPTRLCVNALTNEYSITNFTNSPIEVDIYDIAVKRDVYVGYDFITSTDTYIPATNPGSYWNQGLNAQRGVATTSTSSQVIGSNPTDSQLFRDWFKITKRTTVLLPISGAHRHIVNVKTNRIIDTMLAGVQENVFALREFTKYVMFNVRGMPVYDSVGPNTTTSAAQLGVVAVQRLKYTFIQDFSFTSQVNQGLPTPASITTTSFNWGSGVNNAVAGLGSLP